MPHNSIASVERAYLNHLSHLKGVQESYNGILLLFLQNAYSREDGLTIYINKALKKDIAQKCAVSLSRVECSVTEFVKCGYMKRIDTGKYIFNSVFFGRDEWLDIKDIVATYDYGHSTLDIEIIYK